MRSRFGAEITWLPFDLHPEYPPEGIPRQQLIDRYGPGMTDHVRGMFERAGIGDAAELRQLAAEAGLADVNGVFDGDAYLERVLASTAEAQALGITGIPAFLLDSKLLILGAQPCEVFERAFERLEA